MNRTSLGNKTYQTFIVKTRTCCSLCERLQSHKCFFQKLKFIRNIAKLDGRLKGKFIKLSFREIILCQSLPTQKQQ